MGWKTGMSPSALLHDRLRCLRGRQPFRLSVLASPVGAAAPPSIATWLWDWKSPGINYLGTMSPTTQTLIEELKTAPETVQREVFDFLVFLQSRLNAQAEGAENLLPLAQSARAGDWSTPEEDEAWRDL